MLARLFLTRVRALLAALGLVLAGAVSATPLRVGLYENLPKIYTDPSGRAAGIFPDLLQAIADAEGWELHYVPCDWDDCLRRLERGELDLMPDVALTDERRRRFAFHEVPALQSWSQLYRRDGVAVESVLDLRGRRVAVLRDSVQAATLAAMLSSFGIDAELLPVASLEEAVSTVAEGRADLAAVNQLFGDYVASRYRLFATPVLFQPSRLYFAAPPSGREAVLAAIDRHLRAWQGDGDSVYYRILRRWVAVPAEPVVPPWVPRVVGALVLVGAALAAGVVWLRRRVQRTVAELASREQRLRRIADTVKDVIWTMDVATRRFTYVSPAVQRLRGFTPEEVMAQPLEASLTPEGLTHVMQLLEQGVRDFEAGVRGSDDVVVVELPQPRKDGTLVWTEVSTTLARDPATGRLELYGVTRDISERKAAQARIEQLAHFDHLTGLPNRAQLRQLLERHLTAARRTGQPLALVFFDLDHFKNVNDSLGHAVGDALLVAFAQRLQTLCRAADVPARMGGDEFVVVLPDTDASGAAQFARRLLDSARAPLRVNGHDFALGLSAGVALYPTDGTDLDTLLRNADAAMYQAKAAGRNDFRFFTPELQARSERLLMLTSALAQALAQGELAVHYQPILDLHDGAVCGVEALLRWHHPQLGEVSPAEFIPVAESTGRIVELGGWVLAQALAQRARWQAAGQRLRVAVNVSAAQFRRADFVAGVQQALEAGHHPAQALELELTESVPMGDVAAAEQRMAALDTLGVSVAIDDFGTGYSSLAYLKRLGFDRLKIDRSFVADIGRDADARAIVTAIVRLAHTLGMHTVAEGVETWEQARELAALGCDAIQGWLVARALPPEALSAWLAAHDPVAWRQRLAEGA